MRLKQASSWAHSLVCISPCRVLPPSPESTASIDQGSWIPASGSTSGEPNLSQRCKKPPVLTCSHDRPHSLVIMERIPGRITQSQSPWYVVRGHSWSGSTFTFLPLLVLFFQKCGVTHILYPHPSFDNSTAESCVSLHTYVHIHVHTLAHTCTQTHMHTHILTHVRMHQYVHTLVHTTHMTGSCFFALFMLFPLPGMPCPHCGRANLIYISRLISGTTFSKKPSSLGLIVLCVPRAPWT